MSARRKNGSWMADFMVAGTRYREFGFPAEKDAQAWEMDARSALLRGAPVPKPRHVVAEARSEHTIGALVRHVAKVHWSSKKSAKGLILQAELFARFCGDDAPAVDCLTTAKLDEYVGSLIGKVAGGTINRRLAAVSKLARYAVALGLIPAIPLMSRQQESRGRLRYFSEKEEHHILNTLTFWGLRDEYHLFVFLSDTGARLGEALKVEWGDIHPNGRAITLWDNKDPSGRGKFRTIIMTERVQRTMERRRATHGDDPGPFSSISKRRLRTVWSRLREHHPFLGDAVIHTFRHTCASRLVMAGLDLTRVQKWLGHDTIQTTLRYAKLAPEAMEDVVAALERGPKAVR